MRRRPQPETEEERTADEAFWYWMGCVLFQESPLEQSLESITLLSAHIQARVTALFSTYKAGLIHPLASLAKKVVPHLATSSDSRFAGTSVTIPAGIEVTFHSSIDRDTETLTTPGPIEATLIQQNSQEWSSVVVLIPGLGICSVDARLLSPKRQHIVVEPPQRLLIIPMIRNFVIFRQRGRVQDSSVLESFLGLIGDSLEGLGLRIPTLTVLHLREILAECPNLKSLSVGWASLSSLDFLFNAYDSACTISSLEFTGGELFHQRDSLRRFMDQLCDSSTGIAKSLRRLRLTWLIRDNDLLESVDEMLIQNKLLTHLSFASLRSNTRSWVVERHHGEILTDAPQLLEAQTHLSLARVLRHVARTYPEIRLNDNVQDLIRQFAMTMQTRIVVCESNGDDENL